jgi:hypothetical protein
VSIIIFIISVNCVVITISQSNFSLPFLASAIISDKMAEGKDDKLVPFMGLQEVPAVDVTRSTRTGASASSNAWSKVSGMSVTYSSGKSEHVSLSRFIPAVQL